MFYVTVVSCPLVLVRNPIRDFIRIYSWSVFPPRYPPPENVRSYRCPTRVAVRPLDLDLFNRPRATRVGVPGFRVTSPSRPYRAFLPFGTVLNFVLYCTSSNVKVSKPTSFLNLFSKTLFTRLYFYLDSGNSKLGLYILKSSTVVENEILSI